MMKTFEAKRVPLRWLLAVINVRDFTRAAGRHGRSRYDDLKTHDDSPLCARPVFSHESLALEPRGARVIKISSDVATERDGETGVTRLPPDVLALASDYAETTMNELLGWYGYEKVVDRRDTQGLNLGHFAASSSEDCSGQDSAGEQRPRHSHHKQHKQRRSARLTPLHHQRLGHGRCLLGGVQRRRPGHRGAAGRRARHQPQGRRSRKGFVQHSTPTPLSDRKSPVGGSSFASSPRDRNVCFVSALIDVISDTRGPFLATFPADLSNTAVERKFRDGFSSSAEELRRRSSNEPRFSPPSVQGGTPASGHDGANLPPNCILCAWCQKVGMKLFTLRTTSGSKAFCSELCFTQCRRASFKKNKVCDWCKHVRHTVNYVDFQDGEQQLQFCSDKCLNQYKMNIFCRETQAHLQMHPHLQDAAAACKVASGLITPELWLRDCKSSQQSGASNGHDGSSEREDDHKSPPPPPPVLPALPPPPPSSSAPPPLRQSQPSPDSGASGDPVNLSQKPTHTKPSSSKRRRSLRSSRSSPASSSQDGGSWRRWLVLHTQPPGAHRAVAHQGHQHNPAEQPRSIRKLDAPPQRSPPATSTPAALSGQSASISTRDATTYAALQTRGNPAGPWRKAVSGSSTSGKRSSSEHRHRRHERRRQQRRLTPEHDDMRDSVDTEDEGSPGSKSSQSSRAASRHGSTTLQLKIVRSPPVLEQENKRRPDDEDEAAGRDAKRKCP
ncbi:hypothetical protein MTO96_007190 [Rhipicephalus appendiculatus]